MIGLACFADGPRIHLTAVWPQGHVLALTAETATAQGDPLTVLGLGALAVGRCVVWSDPHAVAFGRLCQAARVSMMHPVTVLGCVPTGGSTLLGLAQSVAATVAGLPPVGSDDDEVSHDAA
jgi:hypothetical protein